MMQIKAILLYSPNGDIRRIDFNLNQVNIITGKSKTGKSSIINIISYCMGRDTFSVAAGIIQDNVDWYAVLYQLDESEVFVAKQRPSENAKSNSNVFFDIRSQVYIPQLHELIPNSNDEALISELSSRLGISSNLSNPPEGQTRKPFQATIRHTEYYLFQPQDVIGSKSMLFYRQAEPFIPQAIKDSMNYFLGVIEEKAVSIIQSINEIKRELKRTKKDFDETKLFLDTRIDRGHGLISEAKQVGLLSLEIIPQEFDLILEILRSLRGWQPTQVSLIEDSPVSSLQSELYDLRTRFRETQEKIYSAKAYIKASTGYINEASEQVGRLESINLFEESEELQICPLCGSPLISFPDTVGGIYKSLEKLQGDLQFTQREIPNVDAHLNYLEQQLAQIQIEINQKEYNLQSAISEEQASAEIRDSNARIARVVGRISYFLDITPDAGDEARELERKIERLQRELNELENKIDIETLQERRASALNIIGGQMTTYSKFLDIDEGYYRFNYDKLTVVQDTLRQEILMNLDMGSGSNYVNAHIITLLAFHWFFINNRRPVPRFLVLDQPSQAYFPQDTDDFKTDEDREAVKKIFDLLFKFATEMGLQIIVLEHANLDTPDYQNAIVENWRQDNALIPTSWIDQVN